MVCNKKTSNLSITINRKIIAKISIIPAIAFLIMAVFVGLSQVINPTKAAHAAPGDPTTISASYDASSVDFHFTSADLVNSAFKQGAVTASVSTNNPTGFTFYISSTDENTQTRLVWQKSPLLELLLLNPILLLILGGIHLMQLILIQSQKLAHLALF